MATTPRNAREWRTVLTRLAAAHQIRICESCTIPGGVWGYARIAQREIVVPPFWESTPDGRGGVLHEIGHVLEGPCPRVSPHYPDPHQQRWLNCIACENAAWRRAMQMAPAFDRAMFEDLKRALGTYRRRTPAPAAALTAARQLSSDTTYARFHQHAIRMEQYREMQAIVNEPRVRPRWERQREGMRAIAREAGYG